MFSLFLPQGKPSLSLLPMTETIVFIYTLKSNKLYGIFKSCPSSFFWLTVRVRPSFERTRGPCCLITSHGSFPAKNSTPEASILSQKLIQRKGGAAGVAKIPARLAIGCWFKHALGYGRNRRAESNALCMERRGRHKGRRSNVSAVDHYVRGAYLDINRSPGRRQPITGQASVVSNHNQKKIMKKILIQVQPAQSARMLSRSSWS